MDEALGLRRILELRGVGLTCSDCHFCINAMSVDSRAFPHLLAQACVCVCVCVCVCLHALR